jgi:MFS family permease
MPPRPPITPAYARYALGLLVVVYVLNFLDRQILSILAEDIKADLGLSDASLGFLYGTAFAVFYAIFGIPLARLADVWVRKNLISVGLSFWSAMTALSGTARGFGSLAAFRIGVGVGESSASPAAFSILGDYFPPRLRATAVAIYSSGVYIGAGIGIFLGGVVVDGWNNAYPPGSGTAPFGLAGWQAAFFVVGLPGLLMALWVWTLREPIRGMSEGLVQRAAHPHPFRATFATPSASIEIPDTTILMPVAS